MIIKYKRHIVAMNNLKVVLGEEVKKLRKDYADSSNSYELRRIGNEGQKKKERLERIEGHIKKCNGLLSKWDTVTNDQLREIIHDGKSI